MVDLARLRRLAGLGDDDDPLERLRKLRERRRLGLAPIPGGLSTEEAATRLNLPTGDEPPYLPALASRTGSFIKRNTMDLLEMITTPRGPAAMTGSPLRGIAEEAEQEFQRREEELARASIDLPTPVAGAGAFASNVAGLLLDPVELIPGGLLARGITSGARRGTRALTGAGRAAGEAVDLALKDVAREAAGGPRPSQFKWEGLVPQETPPALSEAPVARSTALGVSAEVEKNMYLRKAKLLWEWEGATKKRKAEIAKELDMFRGMLPDVYDVPVSGAAGDNIGMNLRSTERAKDSLARAVNPVADTAHKLILNQIDQLIEIEKTKGSAAQILRNLESVKRGMASGEIGAEDAAKMLETLQGRIKQAQDPHLGTLAQATEEMKAKPRPSRAEEFRQAVEALSPSPKQPVAKESLLKTKAKKWLSSRGVVPKEEFLRKNLAIGEMLEHMQGARYAAEDYGRAMRAYVGSAKPSPAAEKKYLEAVDRAIRTEDPQEVLNLLERAGVPAEYRQPIAEPLSRIRQHIDRLSIEASDEELALVNEQLGEIIKGNVGEYVHRSFEAFTNPKWQYKLRGTTRLREILGLPDNPTPRWIAMRDAIQKGNPDLTGQEVEGLLRDLSDKDPTKAFEAFRTRAFPRKGMGEFKRRQELPEVYRQFLGERKDPVVNYLETVNRLSHDIATHKMLKDVRETGYGKIFFDRPTGRSTFQIPGKEGRSPLAGLYATEEMHDAIVGVARSKTSAIRLVNALYKVSATVGSEITHVRNFAAWPILRMMNGQFNIFKDLARGGKGFATATEILKNPAKREAVQYALRSGLDVQGANVGEVKAYIRHLENVFGGEGTPTAISRLSAPVKKGLRLVGRKASQAYGGEDFFWKMAAFEHEAERYTKALPNASREEIGRIAAAIVNDTTPTASRNSLLVQKARENPIVAPFVSFFAEIPRNVLNTGLQALKEMKSANPAIRKIGATRAAGLVSAFAAPMAPIVVGRMITDTGAEEESALRVLGYPWQRHSQMMVIDRTPTETSFIDMSFMDPLAILKRPVLALMSDGPTEAVMAAFKPFLDMELFMGAAGETLFNKRLEGGDIYAKDDPLIALDQEPPFLEGKIPRSVAHIGEAGVPGTIRQAGRIKKGLTGEKGFAGRTFNLLDELLSVFGIRVTRFNHSERVTSVIKNRFWRGYMESRSDLSLARRDVAKGGPTNVLKAQRRMTRNFEAGWERSQQVVQAARKLGMTDAEILRSLRTAKIGEDKARRILRNQPWDPLEE